MAAFLTIPAGAQEPHADLCMYGCPSGSPATNDIIICDIYILSSNDSTKFADWVAYHVTKDTIGQGPNKKLIDSQKKGGSTILLSLLRSGGENTGIVVYNTEEVD